jgi:hypothetical protein
MKSNLKAEFTTLSPEAIAEAAKADADAGKNNTVAIVVPIVILLILVVCVVLFLLHKKKQTAATMQALQSNRGQSRSGTTQSTRTPAAAVRGQPPNQVMNLKPVASQDNPMYGMTSGAIHENDGQVYGGDSTYGDVAANANANGNSGYSDVPVMSIGNAMYDAAAGAGGGVYDAAASPMGAQSKGYMDINPNAAPQQGYMDIAPNQGAPQGNNDTYFDVSPQQNNVRPMDNPTYNAAGNDGVAVYDEAGYSASAAVYDAAAGGGGSTMYDTAGGSTVYDAAAGGDVTAMYDTAA